MDRGDLLNSVLKIAAQSVVALLYALQFLMFGRAIMSWFSPEEDNKLARFLFVTTEPFVYPIRQILNKIEFFGNMPIDMSFVIAMVVLMVCTTFLG
ncbi:MAG: YggT family protein [Oscillospiraceae bacterium]|nr:YggT family protein [Oscillospiraceae bacterium]